MIQSIIEKQKEFFSNGYTRGLAFKLIKLKELKVVIKKYEKELTEGLFKDLGKGGFEAYATEIGYVQKSLTEMTKKLGKWSKDKKVRAEIHQPFSKNFIRTEPYGTVLIIGPYNYPFQLLLEPFIGALAAGNTVVLKPSEETPNTNKITKKIIEEVFPKEHVCVIEGGVEVTQELLHSAFDYVFFTGSVRVGSIVGEICGKNLIPFTLELGGKSPTIVHKNAKVKLAARRIAWGKFLNAGQTCVAPDYVYLHEDVKNEFLFEMQLVIRDFFGENPLDSGDLGTIINQKHYERLIHLIDAKNLHIGGKFKNKKIEPTILTDITWDDAIMQEEIFGPILPILTYNDETDLVNEIKRADKPLALYVFTEDDKFAEDMINSISFGGGCVNDCITHLTNSKLPFGGVGPSGIGQYHGEENYLTFSHRKSITKKPTWFDLKLIYPPFKDKVKIVKKVMK